MNIVGKHYADYIKVNTSPAATRNDRRTPPLTGTQPGNMTSSAKPIATPSTAAYAGPTFHASPAPSALPIPSFYSKSVPDSPGIKTVKTLREVSQSSNSGSSTPPAPVPNNLFRREESPLDFIFKADREEKARARSASSTQTAATASGPFQPPTLSPRNSQTPPAPTSQTRARVGHTPKSPTSSMFAMELDGPNSPGTPFGPAFSTPYSERINAARAGKNSTMSPDQINTQQPMDRTEALKAYLFSGHALPSTTVRMISLSSSFVLLIYQSSFCLTLSISAFIFRQWGRKTSAHVLLFLPEQEMLIMRSHRLPILLDPLGLAHLFQTHPLHTETAMAPLMVLQDHSTAILLLQTI
jgi:hypothetical protein